MIKDLSKKQLIEVIKNGDDNYTNMLVVDKNGNISLFTYEKHAINKEVFSYPYAVINCESFQRHNDYVGVLASKDQNFIETEYARLNEAWHLYQKTGIQQQAREY